MVQEWLGTLGISELCQLEVLFFLYRHRTALLSADQVASFVCYGPADVVAALEHLEDLGAVERSRLSNGTRFYQLMLLPDGPRRRAFRQIMSMMESRSGRLAITKELRETSHPGAVILTLPAADQCESVEGGEGARLWRQAKAV